jgi:microsomal epoxide hydrolase
VKKLSPFKIHVSDEILKDLQRRLASTRWPDEIEGAAWDYGTASSYLKELAEHWQNRFDWRSQEAKLNHFSHYREKIDGLQIHFIYEKGKNPHSFPLILTSGWPSSFYEMTKIIPLLTDSFDVIVPSIPGFGFSDRPKRAGFHVPQIAHLWKTLMVNVLGYSQFGACGSDWGNTITARLAYEFPQHLRGIQVTNVFRGLPKVPYPGTREMSTAEKSLADKLAQWYEIEGGYSHLQATKPQTAAYALNDSPVGLAAWIVEKFRSWSDWGNMTQDELLTNITIYWVTQTISSSMRLYYEFRKTPWMLQPGERIEVPTSVASFPKDTVPPLREWAERFYNIQRWQEFPRGGHFPWFEEPHLMAENVRAFFKDMQ